MSSCVSERLENVSHFDVDLNLKQFTMSQSCLTFPPFSFSIQMSCTPKAFCRNLPSRWAALTARLMLYLLFKNHNPIFKVNRFHIHLLTVCHQNLIVESHLPVDCILFPPYACANDSALHKYHHIVDCL